MRGINVPLEASPAPVEHASPRAAFQPSPLLKLQLHVLDLFASLQQNVLSHVMVGVLP